MPAQEDAYGAGGTMIVDNPGHRPGTGATPEQPVPEGHLVEPQDISQDVPPGLSDSVGQYPGRCPGLSTTAVPPARRGQRLNIHRPLRVWPQQRLCIRMRSRRVFFTLANLGRLFLHGNFMVVWPREKMIRPVSFQTIQFRRVSRGVARSRFDFGTVVPPECMVLKQARKGYTMSYIDESGNKLRLFFSKPKMMPAMRF